MISRVDCIMLVVDTMTLYFVGLLMQMDMFPRELA